jgi:hypothetical protein
MTDGSAGVDHGPRCHDPLFANLSKILERMRERALILGGAELPSRKNLDQFLRKMATNRFQEFGRIAGEQNAGPFANFADAPKFVEEFQNYLGMKRRTELIGHIAVPQVPQ